MRKYFCKYCWVNFNRSSHSIHFPPLCFCHRQIWWQICWQHCIYHQTIYLYSSFDFNETNTTIVFCDVCKIWIIPQISMLPIMFLYWLQKNFISFSILIKQCLMFVFFFKWWDQTESPIQEMFIQHRFKTAVSSSKISFDVMISCVNDLFVDWLWILL